MSLHEHLCGSARRWAITALDAYMEEPPDHDFAVHHMAVAVEHLSKAYLCSINEVLLLGEKYATDDLLILAGHQDRAKRQRSDVKTIGGEDLLTRVVAVLGREPAGSGDLHRLRAVRNGVTHLGLGEAPAEVRARLVTGITYLNDLLTKLPPSTAAFWGRHESLTRSLVEQTVTERQLRYESKLRVARGGFERRFSGVPEWQRVEAITTLSSISRVWGLVAPATCPACGSPALVSGREYSDGYADGLICEWFAPRYFCCPVCDLILEGDELELAGITGHFLSDREEEDPDWEPDADARLARWDAEPDL